MSAEAGTDHRSRVEKESDEQHLIAPALLLCEGAGDAAFFRHLLDNYRIPGFQVAYPPKDAPGLHGFTQYLIGLPIRRGYDDLKHIAIVADSDDKPADQFAKIVQIITDAKLTAPSAPSKPSDAKPAVTVILLPSANEPGTIETLLLKTLKTHDKTKCWEEYFKCLEMDKLRPGVLSKKKTATIIAATNDSNPTCTLHYLWAEKNKKYNPFSIEHDLIKELAQLLGGLTAES